MASHLQPSSSSRSSSNRSPLFKHLAFFVLRQMTSQSDLLFVSLFCRIRFASFLRCCHCGGRVGGGNCRLCGVHSSCASVAKCSSVHRCVYPRMNSVLLQLCFLFDFPLSSRSRTSRCPCLHCASRASYTFVRRRQRSKRCRVLIKLCLLDDYTWSSHCLASCYPFGDCSQSFASVCWRPLAHFLIDLFSYCRMFVDFESSIWIGCFCSLLIRMLFNVISHVVVR